MSRFRQTINACLRVVLKTKSVGLKLHRLLRRLPLKEEAKQVQEGVVIVKLVACVGLPISPLAGISLHCRRSIRVRVNTR
jgi:hypothetical protein